MICVGAMHAFAPKKKLLHKKSFLEGWANALSKNNLP